MPLISDLTEGSTTPVILPPFDVQWVWYCHTLNPVSLVEFQGESSVWLLRKYDKMELYSSYCHFTIWVSGISFFFSLFRSQNSSQQFFCFLFHGCQSGILNFGLVRLYT